MYLQTNYDWSVFLTSRSSMQLLGRPPRSQRSEPRSVYVRKNLDLFIDCPRELTCRYWLAGRLPEPNLLGSLPARVPLEHHPKRASLGCQPAFVDSPAPSRALLDCPPERVPPDYPPPERALLGYQPAQVHPEPRPAQGHPEPRPAQGHPEPQPAQVHPGLQPAQLLPEPRPAHPVPQPGRVPLGRLPGECPRLRSATPGRQP